MDQENSASYYRRREQESRRLAELCSNPAVKLIHVAFAERYAEKVRNSSAKPRLIVG